MQVNLVLEKLKNTIKVNATFLLNANCDKEFSFFLSDKVEITSIKNANWTYIDGESEFRESKKILVWGYTGNEEIVLSYSGEVTGYHTMISDEVLAINYYSAWYPSEFSIEDVSNKVKFLDSHYSTVVKGVRSKENDFWEYEGLDFDCNIMAFKSPKILENEMVKMYYVRDDVWAKIYFEAYNKAVEYCRKFYDSKPLNKIDLCILPNGNIYDGYNRKELIVFGGFVKDEEYIQHLMVHEVAHNWCQGASFDWQDWLNETTAEWTALLFEVDRANMKKFDEIIRMKKEHSLSQPDIRSKDGNRPEGIHDKGVVLFNEIYENYGRESIVKLLHIFNRLEPKTTENYIKKINEIGLVAIAGFIDSRIG